MAKTVRISLVKSPIGRIPKHRRTIQALGLRKMNQSVEKELTPAIEGMLKTVFYMVDVEEIL